LLCVTVTTRVGAFSSTITRGGIVVIITGTTTARQTVENETGGTGAGTDNQGYGAMHCRARCFTCPNNHTASLAVRRDKQRVADRPDVRAVADAPVGAFC